MQPASCGASGRRKKAAMSVAGNDGGNHESYFTKRIAARHEIRAAGVAARNHGNPAISRGRLARTWDCPLQSAQYPSCHGKTGAQAALGGPAGAAPPAGLCRRFLAVRARCGFGELTEQIFKLHPVGGGRTFLIVVEINIDLTALAIPCLDPPRPAGERFFGIMPFVAAARPVAPDIHEIRRLLPGRGRIMVVRDAKGDVLRGHEVEDRLAIPARMPELEADTP